jgi:non-specific serine/threonine protein kinase
MAPLAAPAAGSRLGPLTSREQEVVTLITRGLTNAEIAVELVITERTARAHVEHILAKLGLRSRAQIAAWATKQRLVTPAAIPAVRAAVTAAPPP